MCQLLSSLVVAMRLDKRAGMVMLENSHMDFSTAFSLLWDCALELHVSDAMKYS